MSSVVEYTLNEARAVARAARESGCAGRVYMAHDAAQARVDAIAGEGAAVIRVDGSARTTVQEHRGQRVLTLSHLAHLGPLLAEGR